MIIDKESLAILAWDTYARAVGGKAVNGDLLPTWEALLNNPERAKVVAAWRAVAVKIASTTMGSMMELMTSLTDFKDEVAELVAEIADVTGRQKAATDETAPPEREEPLDEGDIDARVLNFTFLMRAYAYGLRRLAKLKQMGLRVEFVPSGRRNDAALCKKYGPPDRLPSTFWNSIRIEPATQEQQDLVFAFRDELRQRGIGFDTGGGKAGLDWEWDWSFRIVGERDLAD